MKKALLPILLLLLSVQAMAQKATDNFEGNWKTEDGKIIVISKDGDSYTGTSPDRSKLVLENLHFSKDEWKATIIHPKSGEKLKSTALLDGNELKIKVTKGFFSKTLVWKREPS